jgi:hypothetical protein
LLEIIEKPIRINIHKDEDLMARKINRKKWIADKDMTYNYEP